jgi:amino acid transporter
MKMAARKINIRIITLYSLAVLAASFMVPMDHPFINGKGQSVGSHSVFLIAVVEAGIPMAAHFFNAVFVFSSFTCAINSLYVASRVLHTLALREQTGPDFITLRLQQTRSGVPVRAVLATAGMMLIGFMGRTGAPGEVCLFKRSRSLFTNTLTEIRRTGFKLHRLLSHCLHGYMRHISIIFQDVSTILRISKKTIC